MVIEQVHTEIEIHTQEEPYLFSDSLSFYPGTVRSLGKIDTQRILPPNFSDNLSSYKKLLPEVHLMARQTQQTDKKFVWFDTSAIDPENKGKFREYLLLGLSEPYLKALSSLDSDSRPFTIAELADSTESELRKVRGIGEKGAKEIKDKIVGFKKRIASIIQSS